MKGGEYSLGLLLSLSLICPVRRFYPVIRASSCEQSSPQICTSMLPFEINDNSTQVGWRPATPNDPMCTVEALTQQQEKAPFFSPEVPSVSHEVAHISSCTESKILTAQF